MEIIKKNYDKFLHALIGMMIFLCGWVFINIQVGLIACVLVGVFKEISDISGLTNYVIKDNKKEFNFWDMIATCIVPLFISAIISI